jgi:hypothetical protein
MGARLILAGAALGSLAAFVPAKADTSLEYAVKAAYLPKFVPFITWPDTAFTSPSQPVTICVLGGDPFGGKLEQSASAARSGDRMIAVRRLAGPDPEASCHLLFLSGDAAIVEGTLAAMKGKPVVTVTDSGLKAHGVISFLIEANHVRFDIDNDAAAQGGLVISSKLLGLAHAVKQRSQP